jgi:FMN phosphatase YigB (HAD superfamily)
MNNSFPQASAIKVIAFDLGNVLLPFSRFRAAFNIWRATGTGLFKIVAYFLFSHVWQDFDTGHYTAHEFYQKVTQALGLKASEENFRLAFADMFHENRRLVALLPELKKRFRLFLLSDINPIHFEFCLDRYKFFSLFEEFVVSYQVKAKKPSPKIFETLIQKAGVRPEEILFTDDKRKNAEGARRCGIQGIHFTSERKFVSQLRKAGFLTEEGS